MKRKKNDLYAEIKYDMFPEMEGEFKKEDYEENMVGVKAIKLDPVEYATESYYFEKRLELPYGKIKVTVKFAQK